MIDKDLSDKLTKFGYTNLWLDYGILTIEYLFDQEQLFEKSKDKNSEHYRYNTFKHYLSFKNTLSDIEFDNYLQLTFIDKDNSMAGSATIDLFNRVDLTNFPFEKLCKKMGYFGKWTEKVVKRQTWLKAMDIRSALPKFKNTLENEFCKACLDHPYKNTLL